MFDRRYLKKFSLSLSLSLVCCAGILLAGCSNPSVTAIKISPATESLGVGDTAQFTAMATLSQGTHPKSTQNVTSTATWSSSNTGVATISSSGLATAVAPGTTVITASMAGFPDTISATATLTVSSPTSGGGGTNPDLISLTIIPAAQTATAIGQTSQFLAIGTYAGTPGTQVDLTNQATWGSSNASVATVSTTGLATAVGQGTATITAQVSNPAGGVVVGSGVLTVTSVTQALQSVTIIPGSQAVASLNETTHFLAIGTYSGNPGATMNLTNQVTWSSSDPTVASIDNTGVATALKQGTTTITAIANGGNGSIVAGTATLTVTSTVTMTLQSLAVIPSAQTVTALGQTGQFIAIGSYGGSPAVTADVTNQVTWTSSAASVATVNSAGLVTAVGAGTATITAESSNAVTGSASFTVTVPAVSEPLLSMEIIPGSQSVDSVNETGQFIAIGTFSSAPVTRDITSQVTWTSSDIKVATINSSGLVTGLNQGSTAITAIYANPDGTLVTGAASFSEGATGTGTAYSTLTIVPTGANASDGDIVSTDTSGSLNVIHCGPGETGGSVCVGTFPIGTKVTLTATPVPGSPAAFYGWSANCAVGATPNVCTVTLGDNDTVAAIFN